AGPLERAEEGDLLCIQRRIGARHLRRDESAEPERVAAERVGAAEPVAAGVAAGPALRRAELDVRGPLLIQTGPRRRAPDLYQQPPCSAERRVRRRAHSAA